MGDIVALTPVKYGQADGEVQLFAVGDSLDGLSDSELQDLISGGSAVEFGDRQFVPAQNTLGGGQRDEETEKRDALIAKAQAESGEVENLLPDNHPLTDGDPDAPYGRDEDGDPYTEPQN